MRDTYHLDPYRHCGSQRFAKGSGPAGHLIHRGAVPLPLKGKDMSRSKLGETCNVGCDTSNIERHVAAQENGASIIERF